MGQKAFIGVLRTEGNELREENQTLKAEVERLKEAIRQCINRPKGIVPDIVWECGLKERDLTEGKG